MTNSRRIVAIIQARMSSTRLPRKVLLELAGRPVLAHVVERAHACVTVDDVLVATSTDASDDPIAAWCTAAKVTCFRGSLNDVLDRYHQAAVKSNADDVVRITADCPALDPSIVDEVVRGHVEGGYDCYGLSGEFPDGLDCTVFRASALAVAWREARLPSDREHVVPFIERHPNRFHNGGLLKFNGLAHHRWTLDEPRDLAFLTAIFAALDRPRRLFGASDILALLEERPELMKINSDILRNEGFLKSLAENGDHHV